MVWLMVALGGAIGSVLRFGAARAAQTWLGPTSVMGTVFVNITGSFILGVFITLALERVAIPAEWRAFVGAGVLGGYTTFSTFTYESAHALQRGELGHALFSIAAQVILGLLAAYAGMATARAF